MILRGGNIFLHRNLAQAMDYQDKVTYNVRDNREQKNFDKFHAQQSGLMRLAPVGRRASVFAPRSSSLFSALMRPVHVVGRASVFVPLSGIGAAGGAYAACLRCCVGVCVRSGGLVLPPTRSMVIQLQRRGLRIISFALAWLGPALMRLAHVAG